MFLTVDPLRSPVNRTKGEFMKRFHFLLIALISVLLLLPVTAIPIFAESPVWDGKVAEEFGGGTGTAEDPFLIQTPQQLAFLSRSVSIGTSTYEFSFFKLTSDIVLNDTSGWENWDKSGPAFTWAPIGTDMFRFCGTFDGGGHTVSGMYSKMESDNRGLFGAVYTHGAIKNLKVTNSYIKGAADIGGIVGSAFFCEVTNCSYAGSVSGNRAVGGIVGYMNAAVVTGCSNTGAVSGVFTEGNKNGIGGVVGYAVTEAKHVSVIKNCSNTGAVTGLGIQGGGVVGFAVTCTVSDCCNTGSISGIGRIGGIAGHLHDCKVSSCYNIGAVSGTGNYVGGVAGQATACTVLNCYNTGAVSGDQKAGGVAGDIAGTISIAGSIQNCYNIGKVNGTQKVGGVAGWARGISGWFSPGTVRNCFYSEDAASGGINGTDVSANAVALTDAQLKEKAAYVGWDLTAVWEFGGNDPGYAYPTLVSVKHREIGSIAAPVIAEEKPDNSFQIILIIFAAILAVAVTISIVTSKNQILER